MCGTVGMFVGCAALSYCPKRTLMAAATTTNGTVAEDSATSGHDGGGPSGHDGGGPSGHDGVGPRYRSAFRGWHERSAVRAAPRRLLDDELAGLYFSPELVPVARHPAVAALPAHAFGEILIQHLHRYLDFTAKLEYLVVNRTVLGIAMGSVDVRLPEEMRFDAYKIYCDEAYHGLFSVDLARQVTARTAVAPRLPAEPFFLRRLRQILAELPEGDRELAELLFVVISETLISATLADIPNAEAVVPAVREAIRDHAVDEGRHHAYFASFLQFLWAQLTPARRRRAGVLVPRLVDAFLRPDVDAVRADLSEQGMARDEVDQVVGEVYHPQVVRAHARATSRQTIRYFTALGAFDDSHADAQLRAYGLAE